MAESLSIGTDSGSSAQTATASPQTSARANNFGTAQQQSVQPGTSSGLFASTGGIPLGGSTLSTVTLATGTSAQTNLTPQPEKHHVNSALFVISAACFIIAVALFTLTARSAKNTTD